MKIDIPKVNKSIQHSICEEINQKTKPPGALGQLEAVAMQVALVQGTSDRVLKFEHPHTLVFAADHGIARHGVSIAGSEVTQQMVLNFLQGGAAVNTFCQTMDAQLTVINCGMLTELPETTGLSGETNLLGFSAGFGTRDFTREAAMTEEQLYFCFEAGEQILHSHVAESSNVVCFGEMGIGNTSSAAAIFALLSHRNAMDVVGKGTGINEAQFLNKVNLVQSALDRVRDYETLDLTPERILMEVGGFEIAQMVSAMLHAASLKKLIVVDGFIVTAAAMLAIEINSEMKNYMVFSHCSGEKAHKLMLADLEVSPLLNLGLRLGEGTGAVLALPLIKSAVNFYNNMATFSDAGVTV